jgi:nicotinamide riboside transporter PnuC
MTSLPLLTSNLTPNDGLQLTGWLLTVTGQVLVTARQRAGFVVWMVSNVALIVLSLRVGLLWSALMFATNLLCCIWSFWRWGASTRRSPQRRLFVGLARR